MALKWPNKTNNLATQNMSNVNHARTFFLKLILTLFPAFERKNFQNKNRNSGHPPLLVSDKSTGETDRPNID